MPNRGGPSRWLTYLRERSPLPPLLLIAAAQSVSACYLFRAQLDFGGVALSTAGIVGLLLLMRMMDELKDSEKDRVAHPERPIPRGLITTDEMRRAVWGLGAVLLGFAAILTGTRGPVCGALYAATVVYAFLMYVEFFVSRLLASNAFVYALTHQAIIVPMYAFAVAASAPEMALSVRSLWFALTGLGASFAFEICRKLDPGAHAVLGTYLRRHGRTATMTAIVAALALLAVSAQRISVHHIIWPFIAVVLVMLALLHAQPRRFKLVESAVTLLAFVQMLAPTLARVWKQVL
jgi:hypothetical protein